MRKNHLYPPTSGRNIKFECIIANFQEFQDNQNTANSNKFLKSQEISRKNTIFCARKRFPGVHKIFEDSHVSTKKTQFQGWKTLTQKFCASKPKDFGIFSKRNQIPFDFNQFSKTLECPKTTNFKKPKIIVSKLKDFDVFRGEIRPTLDFTHFSKTVKCPKTK